MRLLQILRPTMAKGDFIGLISTIIVIIFLTTAIVTGQPSDIPATITPQTNGNKQSLAPPSPNPSSLNSPSTTPKPGSPKPIPAIVPASILNLSNWMLTLPIDTPHSGTPDEIRQPELTTFTISPYFQPNNSKNGVVFRANVEGSTTSGSSYPRSELREMVNAGKQRASWSNSTGTHTMTIKQAITHLPEVKPHVVAGQIHAALDDVVMIRLEGKRLYVEANGESVGELDPNYSLGTVFTVKIVAAEDRIEVYYNDMPKVDYLNSGSGYYFKAGCYTLSNPSKGDKPGAYGEVVIYDLQVSHS